MLKTLLKRLRRQSITLLPPPVQDPTIPPDLNGNRIRVVDGLSTQSGFQLVVEGTNNYLDIAAPLESGRIIVHLSGSSHVTIGAGCILRNVHIYACPGAVIEIGPHVAMNGLCRFLAHEPKRIDIGSGCLLAGNIDVVVSDMHSILDIKTGKRINRGRDVIIGENVWIGQDVNVMKGAIIGSGSVIGAGAIVTRSIPNNSIAAGSPARVLRRGIRWVHELL